MKKRVFLIVLDSFGIGECPDSCDFGDEGANTLYRISQSRNFSIPTLSSLGLGKIDGVSGIKSESSIPSRVARLAEVSRGKDTTTGHWEIMGIVSENPMPTYPNGFPMELLDKFSSLTGRGVLANLPYSGTKVIEDFGDEHVRGGDLIVYTSADSVFQIAAHEDVVEVNKLYEYCEAARSILVGEHAVGRVIARPFNGVSGSYKRTDRRRDFSLKPPKKSYLDILCEKGYDVISVGKISDIFAGVGITESHPTHSNKEGMEVTEELLSRDFSGLCFINLVDFDMLFGHRQDIDGYAAAISEFDSWLAGFIKKMGDEDALIITADHGCDPGDDSTDHTREYVPMIVYENGGNEENLGTLKGFYNVCHEVMRLLSEEEEAI